MTQPDHHVTVSEGTSLELRCTYSTSTSPYLFWYVQHPNQGLQFLLKYISGAALVTGAKDFEAVLRKNETSFHLKKSSAHWSDSATYFCAVSDTVTETAGGAERKPSKTLGLSVTQELNLGSFQEGLLFMKANRAGGSSSRECFHISAVPHSETLYQMNFARKDIPLQLPTLLPY